MTRVERSTIRALDGGWSMSNLTGVGARRKGEDLPGQRPDQGSMPLPGNGLAHLPLVSMLRRNIHRRERLTHRYPRIAA